MSKNSFKRLGRLRREGKSGQSLVLFAITLPLMLLFVAFVVDAAHAFVDQRHLQNAADAAALAAAQDVSNGTPCGTTCGATATSYVSQNGFQVSSLPTCAGNPGVDCYTYLAASGTQPAEVIVKLYNCTPTYFGVLPGVPSQICESVSSAAATSPLTSTTITPAQTNYNTSTITNVQDNTTNYITTTITQITTGTTTPASVNYGVSTVFTPLAGNGTLFALGTDCVTAAAGRHSPATTAGIEISSNTATMQGSVYSNGGIETPGGETFQGSPVSYNSACTATAGKPTGTFPSGQPTTNSGTASYPYLLSAAQLTALCTSAGATNSPNAAIIISSPGVYCSDVSITAPNSTMAVTMIAPNIIVNGNQKQNLSGYAAGPDGQALLAYVLSPNYPSPYATTPASSPISLSPNNGSMNGDIIAPDTSVTMDGIQFAQGFVEAKTIEINSNGITIGDGPVPGGGTSTQVYTTASTTIPGSSTPDTTNYVPTTTPTVTTGSTSYSTSTSTSITPASTQVSTTGTTIGLAGN